ncbi:MAG: hypothetical protein HY360_03275 [Verrucomicrobia bacterium]|nr:hypothetical protein [Verrucomicrobiota bacterium]
MYFHIFIFGLAIALLSHGTVENLVVAQVDPEMVDWECKWIAFREVHYLNVPVNIGWGWGDRWRIKDGKLEVSIDRGREWRIETRTSFLPKRLDGDWTAFTVLGAPAVGRGAFAVTQASTNLSTACVTMVGQEIFEVGRHLVREKEGDLVSRFTVIARRVDGIGPVEMSAFTVLDENFCWRASELVPLGSDLIVMSLSTDHSYVNGLIFFDLRLKKPIGMVGCSLYRYLPQQSAFWLARAVPKADATPAEIERTRKGGRIVPLFQDGKLNPEFSNVECLRIEKIGTSMLQR